MIGLKIRELREENNFLLRQLAAKLDIDTAQLSKMERGERLFKKEKIIEIAQILNANKKELLTLWLADRLFKIVQGEENVLEALKIIEQKYPKQ
jgi:transcriptional regulator with XRE-family HTH domain